MTPGRSGNHRFSGSLVRAMCAPLHVLVALLCSIYRTFYVACLSLGSPPSPLFLIFFYSFIQYLPSKFSTALPVYCDRCQGLGWVLAGRAHGSLAGRAGS